MNLLSLEFEIPLVSFIFILLLSIVYFSKKKVDLIENKTYEIILFAALISSIVDTIVHLISASCSLEILNIKYYYIIDYMNKIISTMFVVIFSSLLAYTLIISYKKVRNNPKIVAIALIIFNFLFFTIVNFTHIEIYEIGSVRNVTGLTIIIGYIVIAILILLNIFVTLLNFNKKDKRYYAIFLIMLMLIVLYALSLLFRGLIIYDLIMALLCYIMYFTIENPDLKMIEELNIVKEAAVKANNAKTEFLSNMSHEIRTPLNAIAGFSQVLADDKELPERIREDVKDILMASDSLLEIVNGVLDISKIEANKLEIVNNTYNPYKMFDDLKVLTKARIGEKPIEFRVKIDESIPKVLYGDHTRVKQIILNILTNAAKYTNEGYIEFRVDSLITGKICRLIISVEDSGIGIKRDKIDKLFNKFERLDEENNITIEGTGLGLAITKKLVELMQGKLVVQSIYGEGSKFTISIDQYIVKNVTEIEKTIEIKKEDLIKDPDIIGKQVLVVDDNKLNIKVATRLLEEYGIKVDSCLSGLECLDKIKKNKYDLIFMDDMMPKMSGTQTFHKLKEDSNFRTPVVVLTANAIAGMEEKYLSEGFDFYLAKPIERKSLDICLNKYLNNN